MNQNDQEFLVQKIRSQYTQTENESSPLDQLKALDAKVNKPVNIFAYTYGTLGAIIMGAGMSLVMTDIGAMIGMKHTLIPGIAIGILGLAMASSTYPLYKRLLASRRKKYAQQILQLSDSIINK